MNNTDDLNVEVEQAKKMFELRTALKAISQVSFELKEIDKSLPVEYYAYNEARTMLALYKTVAKKVLAIAETIKPLID